MFKSVNNTFKRFFILFKAHAFVRPPRTPSPAQGTAWLTTNSSNGSQIKSAPTVLSSPVRGATVTGLTSTIKPQLVARSQPVSSQTVSTIRPTTAILHSAITIGQGAQVKRQIYNLRKRIVFLHMIIFFLYNMY